MLVQSVIRTVVFCFCAVKACSADIIKLRDGSAIQGTWLGGDTRTIRLDGGSNIRTIRISEISMVIFADTSQRTCAATQLGLDALCFRDGSRIAGQYIGGTARNVSFEAAGKIEVFEIGRILSVIFAPLPASGPPATRVPTRTGTNDAFVDLTPPPVPAVPSVSQLKALARQFSDAMVAGNFDKVHRLAVGTSFQFECVDVFTDLYRARARFDEAASERFGIFEVRDRAQFIDESVGFSTPKTPPSDDMIVMDLQGDSAKLRVPSDNKFVSGTFSRVKGEWKVNLDSFVADPQQAKFMLPELRAHTAALTVAAARIRNNDHYRNYSDAIQEYLAISSSFMLSPGFTIDGIGPIKR